jgi:hypothetical protein
MIYDATIPILVTLYFDAIRTSNHPFPNFSPVLVKGGKVPLSGVANTN